jgi:hypothetical protein
MRRARLAALAFALVALAACAGGTSTAETAITPTPAPDSTTTSTTAPPTTSPTNVTNSAASTTEAPAPTTIAVDDQVRAAYDDRYNGYWACLRAPLACDTSYVLEGSGSADALQATMQGLADRGRFVGDDDVGYYVIEAISVAGDTATVTACWWSTAVLYTGPADPTRPVSPDNPPTVVNDTPDSGRQTDQFVLTNSRWLLVSSQILDEGSETNSCPPPNS